METALLRVGIGVVILLLIALLPVRKDAPRRGTLLFLVGGVAAALAAAAVVIRAADLVLDGTGENAIKTQIDVVRAAERAHVPKNLIIVEGSSHTSLGFDPTLVEDQLQRAGYDATVVKVVAMGGNHMERYAELSRFAAEFRRQGLSFSPNTLLMLEVAPNYDLNPLLLFMNNRNTLRGYRYASFSNLAYAVNAIHVLGHRYDQRSYRAFGYLLRNSLISGLHVGLAPYLRRFDDLETMPRFTGGVSSRRTLHFQRYDPNAPVPSRVPVPEGWARFTQERAERLTSLFEGGITATGYFSVPSLHKKVFRTYVHTICLWARPAVCIDATDPAITAPLDAAQYYFDIGHLSSDGAAVYSAYFAQQLIAQQAVVK